MIAQSDEENLGSDSEIDSDDPFLKEFLDSVSDNENMSTNSSVNQQDSAVSKPRKAVRRKVSASARRRVCYCSNCRSANPDPSQGHTCGACDRSFAKEWLRSHLEVYEYPCSDCGAVLKSGWSLDRHRDSRHIRVARFACGFCGSLWIKTDVFLQHLKGHERVGDGGFRGRSKSILRSRGSLSRLEISLPEDKAQVLVVYSSTDVPFGRRASCSCATCSDPSKKGAKPYVHLCPHCDYAAGSGTTMMLHISAHMGEQPYQCKVCTNAFARSTGLRGHMMKHKGVASVECPFCFSNISLIGNSARFKQHTLDCDRKGIATAKLQELEANVLHKLADITMKLAEIDSELKPKKWDTLADFEAKHGMGIAEFRRQNITQKRMKKNPSKGVSMMAENIWKRDLSGYCKCPNCLDPKINHLTKDQYRHNCWQCEKDFYSARTLKIHLDTIHDGVRKFKCSLCDKRFSQGHHLKNHMLGHEMKPKSITCDLCLRSFNWVANVQAHMVKFHSKYL